jgi:hypothetical protein
MEIGSAGSRVEVAEKVELDRDEQVGEGGQLNAVRVELGLAGKGKSSISEVSRPSGLSGMEEIRRGNASKMKA